MPEKLYTQDEVNAELAKARREFQARKEELEVEIGKNRAAEDELVDVLKSHGVEVRENESLTDAGNRVLAILAEKSAKADADHAAWLAEHTAQHEAKIAPLRAETERLTGEINTRRIDYELTTTAQKLGAFNPDQVVTMLRPHTRVLPGGEIIVQNLMPQASMQSVSEAVDYLSIDKPNLFTRNVTGRPDDRR
ncbi:hypothetical protein Pan44_23110 [Caulifigura coniformis]|uniref:Uncharacterized protein n=1 Tax=Caulifigura coniformis TaxID=2527983 RepID=A0A517SDS7_9PLAN|nr:hypothetical protein [Caulifigura coniformis]QDT54283.1 hypothetical protein Pan44_23110 [Caulifigura coniformis]